MALSLPSSSAGMYALLSQTISSKKGKGNDAIGTGICSLGRSFSSAKATEQRCGYG